MPQEKKEYYPSENVKEFTEYIKRAFKNYSKNKNSIQKTERNESGETKINYSFYFYQIHIIEVKKDLY